ncbi:MAG: hypothetical protein H5T97_13965, partial [Firmicutes bacterium]|nr:hypothetical protein [Bacillota bacterium]
PEGIVTPLRPADAFARACAAVKTRGQERPDGTRTNVLVRQVGSSSDSEVRFLVLETVDGKNVRLDYRPEAARFELDKKTWNLSVQVLASIPEAVEAAARLENLYRHYRTHYGGRTVQVIVQKLLKELRPLTVRASGGVYYVPRQFRTKAEALERFIASLPPGKNGHAAECFSVPVVDSQKNRDMVRHKVSERMDGTAARLAGLLTGAPTRDEVVEAVKSARETLDAFREYRKVLSEELSGMDVTFQVIQHQVMALVDRIENKKEVA